MKKCLFVYWFYCYQHISLLSITIEIRRVQFMFRDWRYRVHTRTDRCGLRNTGVWRHHPRGRGSKVQLPWRGLGEATLAGSKCHTPGAGLCHYFPGPTPKRFSYGGKCICHYFQVALFPLKSITLYTNRRTERCRIHKHNKVVRTETIEMFYN